MAYVRKRTTKPARNRPHLLRLTGTRVPTHGNASSPTCTASADFWQSGERAINRYEREPEGLSIWLAFVGHFLLLADNDAP